MEIPYLLNQQTKLGDGTAGPGTREERCLAVLPGAKSSARVPQAPAAAVEPSREMAAVTWTTGHPGRIVGADSRLARSGLLPLAHRQCPGSVVTEGKLARLLRQGDGGERQPLWTMPKASKDSSEEYRAAARPRRTAAR